MKKIILALLSISLLTACSQTNWDYSDPNMPEGLREKHEEVLAAELAILEEDPEDLDALFEVAFRYHQLGDYKNAVEYYEKVLALSESHGVTLNNLASLYEDMEKYGKAAEYIKLLYASDQTNIEVTKDTVRILLEAGDLENAKKAVENFETKRVSGENPDPALQELVASLYADIEEWEQENE
ncbi:MAG: tetratricopeptide repeat protein [Candidatus Gracilibacteria bacterium]|jgi:tetratricopeptide (TPR) repeat protein